MLSSKNSKEHKILEPSDIWADSSDSSVYSCGWYRSFARGIKLDTRKINFLSLVAQYSILLSHSMLCN